MAALGAVGCLGDKTCSICRVDAAHQFTAVLTLCIPSPACLSDSKRHPQELTVLLECQRRGPGAIVRSLDSPARRVLLAATIASICIRLNQ
jgi:hypothetical protein